MEVADLVVKFSSSGANAVIRDVNTVDDGIDRVGKTSVATGGKLGSVFSIAGGFLAANAITGIFNIGKGLLGVQADAEQARMALETVTGSVEKADELYGDIQQFAKSTPFEFPELVQAAINMEAFGMDSVAWLTTIGDTASAMNKSVDTVVQAVLDASMGEFERLKELGIKARYEGDKVLFTYMQNGKEVVKEVDKNNKEMINSTIQGIWNEKYAGAMEKQSKTFAGQWSTLKDNISMTLQSMTGGIFSFVTGAVGFFNDIFANGFVNTIRDRIGPGAAEFVANVGTMAQGIIDAFGEGSTVKSLVEKLPESWQPFADVVLTAADAFGQMWTNLKQGDWGGLAEDMQQLANAGIDLGKIVIAGTIELAGDLAGNLFERIKRYAGFGSNTGDGTGGPEPGQEFSIGEVLVSATIKLAGDLNNLGESINAELLKKDPIVITPEIELNIQGAVRNAVAGIGMGGGGGSLDFAGAAKALVAMMFPVQTISSAVRNWFDTNIVPDIKKIAGASLRGALEGLQIQGGRILEALKPAGGQLIAGLLNGAALGWTYVNEWLGTRDDAAIAGLGDLITTLETQGKQLIEGFWQGAGDQWEYVTEWLGALDDAVLEWVSIDTGTLFQAGVDLVQGLINGITSMIPFLNTAVGGVNAIINLIDRGKSPWPMMIEAGGDLMDGLIIGMRSGMGDLSRSVAGVNAAINPIGGSASPTMPITMRRTGGYADGGGQPVVIDMRGALIGRGAESEIAALIAKHAPRVIRSESRGRAIAGARA